MKKPIALAVCFFALFPVELIAQGVRSLTGSEWFAESPGGSAPNKRGVSREAPAMQEELLLLRNTVSELSQSLAVANAEAETFKNQASELALKLDALGLAEVEGKREGLEQKLLAAVREVRLQQQRNIELENQVVDLVEKVVALLQEAENVSVGTRLGVEMSMRKANELLGALPSVDAPASVESSLTNALVLEVKPELSLLIANVGKKQGVRVGTPFQILRGYEMIGTALVVDVREKISGLIIQSLDKEGKQVKTGDRLRVITR